MTWSPEARAAAVRERLTRNIERSLRGVSLTRAQADRICTATRASAAAAREENQ